MASSTGHGLYDPRNEHDSCGVGFVVNIKGRKSHDIIRRGLQILVNLDHRGAVGADPLVGDGAGCLIQMPDALLRHWCGARGIELPPPGRYAVAMCFLPFDEQARAIAVAHIERLVRVEGQSLIAWREVPTDLTGLGARVIETMPYIAQAIVAASPEVLDPDDGLQGAAAGAAGRELLCRSARPAVHLGAGAGAPAVLDQHLSVVAAGASLPLHLP